MAGSVYKLLSDGLDEFAPSVTRKSRLKKRGKFVYNKDIAEAKQIRRQLERQCRKHKREIDKQMLKSQRYKVRHLFEQVRALSAPAVKFLPSGHGNDENLAGEFATFFKEK